MSNIRCYQIIAHNGISDIKFRTQNQAQERRSQRINLDFGLMKIYNETISLDFCKTRYTIFAILIHQRKEIIEILRQYWNQISFTGIATPWKVCFSIRDRRSRVTISLHVYNITLYSIKLLLWYFYFPFQSKCRYLSNFSNIPPTVNQ